MSRSWVTRAISTASAPLASQPAAWAALRHHSPPTSVASTRISSPPWRKPIMRPPQSRAVSGEDARYGFREAIPEREFRHHGGRVSRRGGRLLIQLHALMLGGDAI